MKPLTLSVLPGSYAVHRFAADTPVPAELLAADFFHISRTPEELSVLCCAKLAPASEHRFGPLLGLRVSGQLDFALIGILAELSKQLAEAGVSVFAVSTYDTDYLYVRAEDFKAAVNALRKAGHGIEAAERPD